MYIKIGVLYNLHITLHIIILYDFVRVHVLGLHACFYYNVLLHFVLLNKPQIIVSFSNFHAFMLEDFINYPNNTQDNYNCLYQNFVKPQYLYNYNIAPTSLFLDKLQTKTSYCRQSNALCL